MATLAVIVAPTGQTNSAASRRVVSAHTAGTGHSSNPLTLDAAGATAAIESSRAPNSDTPYGVVPGASREVRYTRTPATQNDASRPAAATRLNETCRNPLSAITGTRPAAR